MYYKKNNARFLNVPILFSQHEHQILTGQKPYFKRVLPLFSKPYLPPYSPEFSPIENFWSKVKTMLRKLKVRTYKDLIEGIELSLLQVNQKIFAIGLLTVATVPYK
jgi:hypothetical protein